MRRVLVAILKAIGFIAAGVAALCPFGSVTQVLVFAGSLVLFLVCYGVLNNMDEPFLDDHLPDGYWPKPLDLSPPDDSRHETDTPAVHPSVGDDEKR